MSIVVTTIGTATAASGSTYTITVPAGGVPQGALIFIATEENTNIAPAGSVTDTAGNTYTNIHSLSLNATQANGFVRTYYVKNATALVSGNTITITKSGTNTNATSATAVYAVGVNSVNPLDTNVSASATGATTTPTVTSGTPTVAGELFLAVTAYKNSSGGSYTQASGFSTPPTAVGTTTTGALGAGNLTNAAKSTQAYSPTLAGTITGNAVMIAGFLPAQTPIPPLEIPTSLFAKKTLPTAAMQPVEEQRAYVFPGNATGAVPTFLEGPPPSILRLQYQAKAEPVLNPNTQITQTLVSRWFEPLSEPVLVKPAVPVALQEARPTIGSPPIIPVTLYPALSEPVRQKPGLTAATQPTVSAPAFVPAPSMASWFEPLSEPVRAPLPRFYDYGTIDAFSPNFSTPSFGWYANFADPLRIRPQPIQQTDAFAPVQTVAAATPVGFYAPWSEPVRTKPVPPLYHVDTHNLPKHVTVDALSTSIQTSAAFPSGSNFVVTPITISANLPNGALLVMVQDDAGTLTGQQCIWNFQGANDPANRPMQLLNYSTGNGFGCSIFGLANPYPSGNQNISFEYTGGAATTDIALVAVSLYNADQYLPDWTFATNTGTPSNPATASIASNFTRYVASMEADATATISNTVGATLHFTASVGSLKTGMADSAGSFTTPHTYNLSSSVNNLVSMVSVPLAGQSYQPSWFEPLAEPSRAVKPTLAAQYQQDLWFNPFPLPSATSSGAVATSWDGPPPSLTRVQYQAQAFVPVVVATTPTPVGFYGELSVPVQYFSKWTTSDNSVGFIAVQTAAPAEASWHYPWSEPVRIKPALSAALQQPAAFAPFPQAVTIGWVYPWSEPVRTKPILHHLTQVDIESPNFSTPSIGWNAALSEPTRLKPFWDLQPFNAYAPFVAAPTVITGFLAPLTEPVRIRPPINLGQVDAFSPNFSTPSIGWNAALSEPVRLRPILNPGLHQFIGQPINPIVSFGWNYPWSEPVRLRPGLLASLQEFQTRSLAPIVQTYDRFGFAWSEPVRTRPLLIPALQEFYSKPLVPIVPVIPTMWGYPWTEPVRIKPGLRAELTPYSAQVFLTTLQTVYTAQMFARETDLDRFLGFLYIYNSVVKINVSIIEPTLPAGFSGFPVSQVAGARVAIITS